MSFLFKDDPLLQPAADDSKDDDNASKTSKVKDSGVSRVFLIGVAPRMSELYDTVDHLMEHLAVEKLKEFLPNARLCVAVDIKMMMIVEGDNTHSVNSCLLFFFRLFELSALQI